MYIKCTVLSVLPEVVNAPFNDGWIKDKKLLMSCLRPFGFGPNQIGEENVLTNTNYLCDNVLKLSDQDVDLKGLLQQTNANIILKILCNKGFHLDDQFLKDFVQQWNDWFAAVGGFEALICYLAPTWLVKLFPRTIIPSMVQTTEVLRNFFRKEVNEHLRTLDKDNPRDFIDMYVVSKGEELNLDRLVNNVFMHCVDPMLAVGCGLQWVILYLTLYQDVQKKMQDEMDKVWYLRPFLTTLLPLVY